MNRSGEIPRFRIPLPLAPRLLLNFLSVAPEYSHSMPELCPSFIDDMNGHFLGPYLDHRSPWLHNQREMSMLERHFGCIDGIEADAESIDLETGLSVITYESKIDIQ